MENTALSLFPSDDLSDGLAQLRQELIEVRGEVLKPAPRLTGSKWVVEKRCKLSADNSSEPGLFRPFGFQNEWFDVFVDPKVKKVSIKKSARVGATRCACFGIGYFIEADPSLVMFVRPKDGDAEFFSKTEWAPTVRDNDFLAALKNPNTRGETQDTVMDKRYTNGAALMIRGAEAPDNLRGLTARIMFADEIDADGWKTGKGGGQGDKLDLVEKRGETFWNSKLICMSTPLKKGESLIEAEYLKGDQRKYFVPCPHCGEMQVLEFGGKDLPYGLKWEVDPESGLVVEAYYVCAHNGCIIQESSKPWMIDSGEWRPTAKPKEAGHVSYHIWTAYSLFPKAAWKNIAQAFVNAQSNPHEKLQPFVNLWLGESWEDRAVKTVSPENLQERAEPYEAEVPQGVAYLTAGIDTQDNRLEVEIVGWGRGEESWSVDYKILLGDPLDRQVWDDLDGLLFKSVWRGVDGREFRVQAACIDTGGHATQAVYDYVRKKISHRVWGIKGQGNSDQKSYPIWPGRPTLIEKKGGRVPVYILGTDASKDLIAKRLTIRDPGPGYMHFPAGRDEAYFEQIAAEKKVWEGVGGRRRAKWVCPKGKRNEALDCRVYATAALYGLKAINKSWEPDVFADRAGIPQASAATPSEREETSTETPAPPVKPAPRRIARRPVVVRSSFMSR